MMLNFCTNTSEHHHRLEQVFRSFEAVGKTLVFSASTSELLEIPISFKIFSPFLRDLVASQALSSDTETLIILPECSPTSIKHLINLLSHGSTKTSGVEDVETLKEDALVLGIDLKNLSYNYIRTGHTKVEEVEEGEILDDEEEYYEDNVTEELNKSELKTSLVKHQIRVASFATADLAIPNIAHQKQNSISQEYDLEDKKDKFLAEYKRDKRTLDDALTKSALEVLEDLLGLEKGEGTESQESCDLCNICQIRLTSKSELLKHYEAHQKAKSIVESHHRSRKLFKCYLCNYSIRSSKNYKKHMRRFHGK